MGIYSVNRTGSMAVADIKPDMSYGPNSFNRIMYESVINDQILFEAVLANDFAEIKALKEGTLLEAEAEEKQKKGIKDYANSIATTIKQWASKILGAIGNALKTFYAKVTKNAKPLIVKYNKVIKNNDGKLPNVKIEANVRTGFTITSSTVERIVGFDRDFGKDDNETKKIENEMFGKLLESDSPVELKEFKSEFIKKAFEKKEIDLGSDDGKTVVNDAINRLKNIKWADEDINKDKDALMRKVNDLLKTAEEINKETEDDDKKENIDNYRAMVKAYQDIMTVVVSAKIQMMNIAFKSSAMLISKVISLINGAKNESAVAEYDDTDVAIDMDENNIDDDVVESPETDDECEDCD